MLDGRPLKYCVWQGERYSNSADHRHVLLPRYILSVSHAVPISDRVYGSEESPLSAWS
jgi:hypothetical protein